jgi:hypothetical protein
MTDKQIRIPLAEEQRAELAELLKAVPTQTVVRFDWNNPEGRAFIARLRQVQVTGVPLSWIAADLDCSTATLNGAIGYYERTSTTRGARTASLPAATEAPLPGRQP